MIDLCPLERIFAARETEIRSVFDRALADASLDQPATLILASGKSRFEATHLDNQVRVTWCGVASLWAFCQGVAIIGKRATDARQRGILAPQLDVKADPKLSQMLTLFDFSVWISEHPNAQWPTELPHPSSEQPDGDQNAGEFFFRYSLGWIFRHELAHIRFRHSLTGAPDVLRSEENQADSAASKWLKGNYATDSSRVAGEHPNETEMELERRALAAEVVLLWVALFEKPQQLADASYPRIAERMMRGVDLFELPDDSFAAQIVGDALKAWLDPEGDWPQEKEPSRATATASLMEGLKQLHQRLTREQSPE
jgi:hypothetical protein